MAELDVTTLTEGTLTGTGVFDALMRAHKAHLEAEFTKQRIKGPEYATVYLGSLEAAMRTALEFIAQRARIPLEAQLLEQQVALTTQQVANAVAEHTILEKQACKLDAEFDVLKSQNLKLAQEIALLAQKIATERAQTVALGVDEDSVVGRQKALYHAQTEGFKRNAEQEATKILAETWSVRRTTDEGVVADGVNMLNDATIGRAVSKMLQGVGA